MSSAPAGTCRGWGRRAVAHGHAGDTSLLTDSFSETILPFPATGTACLVLEVVCCFDGCLVKWHLLYCIDALWEATSEVQSLQLCLA